MKDGCVHLEVGDIKNMKCEKGVCHGKLHARKVCVFLHGCEKNVCLPGCDGNVCVLLDVRCVKGVFFLEMWGAGMR